MSRDDAISASATPLITVAMPVYNAGRYLRLAVLSIIRQTYPHWELLLIDDGSTDNALEFIADLQDERIHIIRDGLNKGLAARLNECIDLAQGQYIARMDQDDVSFPQRFERQIQALQQNPELDLVAVRVITISNNDEFSGWLPYESSQSMISAKPWRSFYMAHPCWMGKTTWFRKYRYAVPGPYFCEDQELLLRSHESSRFDVIPEPLLAYRIRNEINRRKLFKTRITVVQVQLNYFISKKQISYAILSVLVFIVRVLLDILHQISRIIDSRPHSESEQIAKHWRGVLHSINGDN